MRYTLPRFSNTRNPLLTACCIPLMAIAAGSFVGCVEPPPPTNGGDDPNPNASNTVALVLVADGLTSPLGLVEPDDGSQRRFIYDQTGTVHILNSNGLLNETPFLDVSDRMPQLGIDFGGGFIFDERGLIGLAFHPAYAENGRFFVYYTVPQGDTDPPAFDSRSRLSEFRVSPNDPNIADTTSELALLEIPQPQFNHNGGQLAFGPDGYLYVAIGDGGESNDVGVGHTPGLGNAQDRTNLFGSILRIDVDSQPDAGLGYAIPQDNPFVDEPAVRGEIFAYGFRNPFRFSFDAAGNRELFVADVGQDLFEEVSIVARGGNFGWNIKEGDRCFDTARPEVPAASCPDVGTDGTPLVEPILTYPHVGTNGKIIGISVIGGFVYRGSAIPKFEGQYIFGDFSTDFDVSDGVLFIASKDNDNTWTRRELAVTNNANNRINKYIFAFGQDRAGEIYVMTSNNVGPIENTGAVYKLVPIN